jgi:hypothetical protein
VKLYVTSRQAWFQIINGQFNDVQGAYRAPEAAVSLGRLSEGGNRPDAKTKWPLRERQVRADMGQPVSLSQT